MASVVREIVAEAIARKVSDPRVSPFTSITRVAVAADLAFADVHVSVMGDDAVQRTTLRGLQSARGMIQSVLARELSTRTCPAIRFHLDQSIKKSIETIRQIEALNPHESRPDDVRDGDEADEAGVDDSAEAGGRMHAPTDVPRGDPE